MTLLGPDGKPLTPVTKAPAEIHLPNGDVPLTPRQAADAQEFYVLAREWMQLARRVEAAPPRSRQAARFAQMKLDRLAARADKIGERLNGLTLQAFLDALKAESEKKETT